MRYRGWAWPAWFLGSTACVAGALLGPARNPIRSAVVVGFLLLCPGLILKRLLQLKGDANLVWAIALSLVLEIAMSMVMLYTRIWSPKGLLLLLLLMNFATGVVELVRLSPGETTRYSARQS